MLLLFGRWGKEETLRPAALRIASETPLPSPPLHPEARIVFGRNPRASVTDPHVAHFWNPARRRVARSRRISRPPITSAAVPAAASASSRPLLGRRRPISFAFCRVRLAALVATRAPLEDSRRLFVLQTLRPLLSPTVPRLSLLWHFRFPLPSSPPPSQVSLACLPSAAAASLLPQPRRLPRSSLRAPAPGPFACSSWLAFPSLAPPRLPQSGAFGVLSDFAERSPRSRASSVALALPPVVWLPSTAAFGDVCPQEDLCSQARA